MALWPLMREVPSLLLNKSSGSSRLLFVRSISLVSSSCSPVSGQGLTGRGHDRFGYHGTLSNKWSKIPLKSPLLSHGCSNVSSNPTLPPLMEGEPVVWPKLINSLRNWFFINFVIRPYMDREFSIQEFEKGAREAVSVISTKLSKAEYEDLEDLIEPEAFAEIKRNLAKFNVAQRELLPVNVEDIYFQFPYEIGIILPDRPQEDESAGSGPQVRQVEIMMVFHVMRGIAAELSSPDFVNKSPRDFLDPADTQRRLMVCNYRFFRDFTEGKDPTWIVNLVNHFMPTEVR